MNRYAYTPITGDPIRLSLSGCAGVESALHEAGEKIQSNRVETPQNNGGNIDWSFVPVVREKAVSLFTEAFPEAKVRETGVACKNTKADRGSASLRPAHAGDLPRPAGEIPLGHGDVPLTYIM